MKKEIKTIGIVLGDDFMALDIDNATQMGVEQMIDELIEKKYLGNCVLIKTSDNKQTSNWAVMFFWNIMPWQKVVNIIRDLNIIDEDFKQHRIDYGTNRIRIGKKGEKPKPKIIKIMNSPYHRFIGCEEIKKGDFYCKTYQEMIK